MRIYYGMKRRDLGLGLYRAVELCGMKVVDERINEGVLPWFSHVERMERDRSAKSLFSGYNAEEMD